MVNLDNVRKTIDDKINATQKNEIIKDLEAAVSEFVLREIESEEAAHVLPFVTVNKKTNRVAIFSRLLLSLRISIQNSVKRLNIEGTTAFNEVRRNIQTRVKRFKPQFLAFSCRAQGIGLARRTPALTAENTPEFGVLTANATT